MAVAEFTVADSIQTDQRSPERWIFSHLIRHIPLFFVLFVGAFGNAAGALLIPVMIGEAFRAVDGGQPERLGWVVAVLVGSQFVRSVLQFGRNFSAAVIGERVERDTRQELYTSLLGKSMTFHALQPVGDTMARATNDVRELNLMVNPGFNLVIGSLNFMIMPIIFAPRYHPQLLATPLFFGITYIIAISQYLGALRPLAIDVRASFGRLNSRLAEAIDGIEMVKGAAQEEQEVSRFNMNAHDYRDAVVAQGKVEARYWPLLLFGTTIALAFTHSLILAQQGQIEVADVIGYTGTMGLFGFPTFVSLFAYAQVARGFAGAGRVLELIQTKTELDQNEGGVSAEITGRVTFENVNAGYLDGIDVLHNINFSVEPGQTVAIVGQTGSGKSSLVKLINRTYDVRQGRVLVDGQDVREWDMAALRQQISIIEQDVFLFSRSIADNIAFGDPNATREQVIAAAKDAQAHEFISEFSDGYETVIGERGVTLSGGQRQRLALARAFLTRPHILVLDDSTSAVDSATEDKIQKAIARAAADQTTFLITHRLSQIRWADVVVLLKQGRVMAVGNHDSLMRDHEAYRQIFQQ